MSKITSLIMPSTIADEATIRQLLLFSDSVFQFAPSEDSINTTAVSTFKNSYNHYPPVPFAEDLETFQKFIKDLTSYRAEYYTGALSNLSSGLSTDIDESSVWQLINKLAKTTSSHPQAEKLMHARLLLTLAEIHHNEEDEINSALAAIDGQVGQVLSELKNEANEQVADNAFGKPQIKNVNPLQLLKAWFHLFQADTTVNTFSLIATDDETLSTLNEYASTLISPKQDILCTLSMPAQCLSESQEKFNELWDQFQQTKQSEIKKFQANIMQAAEGTLLNEKDAEEFSTAIEDTFGNNPHGPTVTFHTIPLSLPQLAAKVTKTTIGAKAQTYPPNTIVAVIKN